MNRLISWLKDLVAKHVAMPRTERIEALEEELAKRPDVVHPTATSPERFEILYESLDLPIEGVGLPGFPRSLPYVLSSMRNIRLSLTSLSENPEDPVSELSEQGLRKLKDYASSVGVDVVGFTRVDSEFVFKYKGVLHEYAIVLVMEMDHDKMAKAPSTETAVMVHETYDRLGQASNRIAEYLRDQGYSAHAGHPLGGLALYPPLAQSANLGWRGAHGLIITPEFGPRVRLAAVYTNIVNLPLAGENEHQWISEFCDHCNLCRRQCPPGAIRDETVYHDEGHITCIDRDLCFPYFATHEGCSVCIKVCPFNNHDYAKLKERADRLREQGYWE